MGILDYIEYGLARLLINYRGYDDQLFCKGPAFAEFPEPTFEIESPDCGPSNSTMTTKYSKFGEGRMPELKWPVAGPDIKEYLLISEDPDSPMGGPNVHGIYYSIPATTTAVSPREFEVVHEEETKKILRSGFRYGKNRRSSVYIPPRPPVGHGPHRYFFELVALKEPLDLAVLSPLPAKEELSEVIKGKVAGWGLWIGIFENKWE
jgi:phosphatidylethanolamine-binding protein (PEBP) family uncharacterized protein